MDRFQNNNQSIKSTSFFSSKVKKYALVLLATTALYSSDASASSEVIQTLTTDVLLEVPAISGDATVLCSGDYTITGDSTDRTAPWEQVLGTLTLGTPLSLGATNPLILGNGAKFHMNSSEAFTNILKFRAGDEGSPSTQYIGNDDGELTLSGLWAEIASDDARTSEIYTPEKIAKIIFEGTGITILKSAFHRTHNGSFVVSEGTLSFEDSHEIAPTISNIEVLAHAIARLGTAKGLNPSSTISLHDYATFDIAASVSTLPNLLYKTLIENSIEKSAAPRMTISANATFTNSIADEKIAYPASVGMTGTNGELVVFNSDTYTAAGPITSDKLKFDIQKTIIADSESQPIIDISDSSNTGLSYLKLSCAKPFGNTNATLKLNNTKIGLNYDGLILENSLTAPNGLTVDVSANAKLTGTWATQMMVDFNDLSLLSDTSTIRTITHTNNINTKTFTTRDIRLVLDENALLSANEINVTTSQDYRTSIADQESPDFATCPGLVLSATNNPLPSGKSINFDEDAYLIVKGANYTIDNPLTYTSAKGITMLLFNANTTFSGAINVIKANGSEASQKFWMLPGNIQASTINLSSAFSGIDELYLLQSNFVLQDGISLPNMVSIGAGTMTINDQDQVSGVNLFTLSTVTIATTGMPSLSNNITIGDDFILQSDSDFEYTGAIFLMDDKNTNTNAKVTFENTAQEMKNITISGEQTYTGPTEFKNALVTIGNTMQTSSIEVDTGSQLTLAGTANFPKISQLEIGDGAKLILDLASSSTKIAIGNSTAELTIKQNCEYSGTISGDYDFKIKFLDNETALTFTNGSTLEHTGSTYIDNGGTVTINKSFALESENLTRTNSTGATIFSVTPFISGNAVISVPVGSTIGVNQLSVTIPELIFTALGDEGISYLDTLVESTLFAGNITTPVDTVLKLRQYAVVDTNPAYYFEMQGIITSKELHVYASTLLKNTLNTSYVYIDSGLKFHVGCDKLFDDVIVFPVIEYNDAVKIIVPKREAIITNINGTLSAKIGEPTTLNLICEMDTEINGDISGTHVNIIPTQNSTVTLKKDTTFSGTLTIGEEETSGTVTATKSFSASALVLKKKEVKFVSSATFLFAENVENPTITAKEKADMLINDSTVNATIDATAAGINLDLTGSNTFSKLVDATEQDVILTTTLGGEAVFNGPVNASLLTINKNISATLDYAGTSNVSVLLEGEKTKLTIGKDQAFTENNSLRCNDGEILTRQKTLSIGITNGQGNVTITAAALQADGYDAVALNADLDLLSEDNNATEALMISGDFGLSPNAQLNIHGAYGHNLIELAKTYDFDNPIRVLANVTPEHVVTTSNTLAITHALASTDITIVQGSGLYIKGDGLLTSNTTVTFEADDQGAIISNFRFDGTVLNANLVVPTNANVMAKVLTDTNLAGTLSGEGVIQFNTTLTDLEEIRSIALGDVSNFAGTIILSGGAFELQLNQINSNLKIVCADENTSYVLTYNNTDITPIFQDPMDMANGALKSLLVV